MAPKRSTAGVTVLFIFAAVACLAAPTYAQELPGCRDAWNDLGARGAYPYAKTLIEADCPVMYREGWLINPDRRRSSVIPSCVVAWNALAREGALPAVRFLVMHNCPVLKRKLDAPPGSKFDEVRVKMISNGGVFHVPVLINHALKLNFVVDSGASDVSIPADVVLTLIRTGTIEDADFVGTEQYRLADGPTVSSRTFIIRSLNVGDRTVTGVRASIADVNGPLLLGQSFLNKFKSWSQDNVSHELVLQ